MSHNWPVYGHDWAVDYLRKGMFNDRLRHAYLITGTTSVGKSTLAHAFAMALNCQHEDIAARPCMVCRSCKKIMSGSHTDMLYSESDERTGVLKIDAIRALTSRIAMKPYEGRYRVAIFEGFDRAQPRAQDALLKTLEEPPPYAVLILLATSREPILSTITSRSQIIALRPVPAPIIADVLVTHGNVTETEATELAHFSGGRIGWAINAAQNPEIREQRAAALDMLEEIIRQPRRDRFATADSLGRDKPALLPLLELWQTYWRDMLLHLEGSDVTKNNADRVTQIEQFAYDFAPEDALRALHATQDTIKNLAFNLNLRLALEVMFLEYPGLKR